MEIQSSDSRSSKCQLNTKKTEAVASEVENNQNIFIISNTKLDDSFPMARFIINLFNAVNKKKGKFWKLE